MKKFEATDAMKRALEKRVASPEHANEQLRDTVTSKRVMQSFSEIEKKINYTFKNPAFLKQAVTHRSYLNENRDAKLEHNERLEFLGDAVLELVVTEFLYAKYPDKPEGELTAFRAALVNTQSISEAATKLGLNDHLLLSRGEAKDTGRARMIILANAFEALIGALYLDAGYDAAQKFIAEQLFHKTDEVVEKRLWQDAKSKLQEIAQERQGITPTYQLMDQSGPDHDKTFVVAAFVGAEKLATGEGRSKQEAEQDAAQKALAAKGW
jgi:ribonuclease-3